MILKKSIRAQKLLERLQQHSKEKNLKNRKIFAKLIKFEAFQKAINIMFYLPIHGEVDLTLLFEKFPKKHFILPRVNWKILDLHYIKSFSGLVKGKFQLLEPKKTSPKAKISDIEIVLVPGIVFSHDGHRIGYGKGFYDRLLKKICCIKIGIAYDFQIMENVAAEKHDVPMDMIITEKRTIKIKPI